MEAPPLERKLAAILAADVEGYSRLMHLDEEQTLATLTSHRTIVDGLIEKAHGQVFGTAGDSALAEFPSIVHAFQCAVAIQQAIWRANQTLPDDRRMNFRIGINVGDVMVKNGDIFGDGVNIAARLETLADVGGICVSRGVRDHLRDRVDTVFEDLGEQNIKNIARPLRVFRVKFDPQGEPILEINSDTQNDKRFPESVTRSPLMTVVRTMTRSLKCRFGRPCGRAMTPPNMQSIWIGIPRGSSSSWRKHASRAGEPPRAIQPSKWPFGRLSATPATAP